MTRLTDLPPAQAKRLAELECPDFTTRPWVTGSALSQRRVAIVSSAGLVVRGEDPFRGRDADYRVIPSTTRPEELLISHISINFDRTGFQEDWNVVFPLDRLRELAVEGAIGSVAQTHYSFMGATDPVQMEPHAREVAGLLKGDQVDAVPAGPNISAVSPAAGPATGGQVVTVHGVGFLPGMTATIGGVAVTPAAITSTSFTFTALSLPEAPLK